MEPPLSVCQRLLKADDTGDDGDCDPWLVLSADQRASLRQRGFAVLDGLAPADLATEAYEEASFKVLGRESKRIAHECVTDRPVVVCVLVFASLATPFIGEGCFSSRSYSPRKCIPVYHTPISCEPFFVTVFLMRRH